MPFSIPTLIRAAIMLVLATHAFFMYSTVRTMSETVGLSAGTSLIALGFAAAMMVPLVWAFGIADLPEVYLRHIRPAWRWRRGQCPRCGYALTGLPGATCPECGSAVVAPAPYRFGLTTVRRFALLVAGSLVLGAAVAEGMILADEAAFRSEVAIVAGTQSDGSYRRPRAWPNGRSGLVYSDLDGSISAHD